MPLVCVSASVMELENRRHLVHGTGAKNIDAVERFAGCVPVMLPALGERLDVESFVERIDGLVLTGGRANVEPRHYDGPPFPDDEPIDPERDATALAMVRACVAARVPVFGICRGIQEMNVALGGSLHYRLHLLEDKDDHRMPRHDDVTVEEIFRLRHPVRLARGGLFERLAGASEVMVNSLHGQGIDELADTLEVEAVTPDGVIEGVRLGTTARSPSACSGTRSGSPRSTISRGSSSRSSGARRGCAPVFARLPFRPGSRNRRIALRKRPRRLLRAEPRAARAR